MSVYGQLGFKTEVTWGTPVTVDQFHEGWLTDNPVRHQPPNVSQGIRAGRRTPTKVQAGPKTVEGSFSLELFPAPLATLLRHMFGTIATTGAGPYAHTASPGDTDAQVGFTAQVGIPDAAGTVHPFTYQGCRITGWTMVGDAGEIATLDLEVVAQDYLTATSLESASYGTLAPFDFVDGSVSIDGADQAQVTSFELAATIPRRIKHAVGSQLIIEPNQNGRHEHAITVETDFEDLTLHDLANSEVAVVLKFDNGSEDLTVTCNAYVEPSTPTHPGVDGETVETFTAMCAGTSDANTIQAVLNNSESTSD